MGAYNFLFSNVYLIHFDLRLHRRNADEIPQFLCEAPGLIVVPRTHCNFRTHCNPWVFIGVPRSLYGPGTHCSPRDPLFSLFPLGSPGKIVVPLPI